jgi:opacity protein-like surface antigen
MKPFAFLLAAFLLAFQGKAQDGLEISPSWGWQMAGRVNLVQGVLDFSDNENFGIDIAVPTFSDVKVVLGYTYFNTNATFRAYNGFPIENGTANVDQHLIQLGGQRELDLPNDAIVPYGLGTLGVGWTQSNSPGWTDVTRFAVTLGGGVKFFVSDRIGLRFQGRFILPINFAGVGYTIGTGGSGLSVVGVVPILQGDLAGAVIFRL